MRLAYFSPFNPTPTGISDYSEDTRHLAPKAEIELIVDGAPPTNPALAAFPWRTLAEFQARAAKYDVILYHMGNSPADAAIYEMSLRYPGVVVMHDLVLHHLRGVADVGTRQPPRLSRRDANSLRQRGRAGGARRNRRARGGRPFRVSAE